MNELEHLDSEKDAEIARLQTYRSRLQALVDEQAEDDGLWFMTNRITEAYFQQELRRLHALVEVEP